MGFILMEQFVANVIIVNDEKSIAIMKSIDHVIPISKINLNIEEQQLLAFNWRNTMPLSCEEKLKKNNKIIYLQIEQHYKKLVEYHKENKLDLPQVYIDLFAKHLDVREHP
jgi:hypothetical protein